MTGYLYILKHGIGPGTMPNDVTILKEKDLPNYYTAVWLDRFLTTSELKQYDIPSETRINELLDRIDYCQVDNGDDVVPCDKIKACGDVMASEYPSGPEFNKLCNYYAGLDPWIPLEEIWDMVNADHGNEDGLADDITAYVEHYRNCTDEGIDSDDVEACDKVTASKIIASKMSDVDILMREALECTTKDELSAVISGLDSLGLRKLYLHYMEMLRDDSLSVGYIASDLSDTLYNMFSDEVNACDNVMASEICYRDRNNDDRVVALDVGMSDEDVEEMLAAHPSYYRSTLDRFDDVDACDDIKATTDTSSMVNTIYSVMMNYEYGYDPDMTDIDSMLQELTNKGVHVDTSDAFKKAWVSAHNKAERKTWGGFEDSYRYDALTPRELDAIENYDTEYWEYVKDHPLNIKPASATDITSSTDTKYFANMVSADTYFRHPEEWGYEVQGYYDIDRRGLAESDWTEDIRMVNDLLNEYANKGYYLRVTNRYAGVILDIDADDWFDSFYPDGLSEGELE